MKRRKHTYTKLLVLLGLLLFSCGPVETLTPTVTIALSATNTLAIPTVPLGETPIEPTQPTATTPTLGPAIPHLNIGQKVDITYIHMNNAMEGWGIGGVDQTNDHVFRTSDGGQTWRDVTPPEPIPEDQNDKKYALAYFLDSSSAWVVYRLNSHGYPIPDYGIVWRTSNGGTSWQPAFLDINMSGEGFFPSDMVFVNDQYGWFLVHMGGGMHHDYVALYATDDGGVTWQAILTPYNDGGIQSLGKTGMSFFDEHTGWLTMDNLGVAMYMPLFYTNDGGLNWQEIHIPAPAEDPELFDSSMCKLHSPQVFSSTSAAFALNCEIYGGDSPQEKNYLYFTVDSGSTWSTLVYPGGQLILFSEDNGLALGRSIDQTFNGGLTWEHVKDVNWDGQFSFVDPNIGWAVARSGLEIALVKTTNGGATWQEIEPHVGQ